MSSLHLSGWVVLEAWLPNLKGSGNSGDLPFSAEELSSYVTTVKTQGLCLVWADQVSAVLSVVRPWSRASLANMERRGSDPQSEAATDLPPSAGWTRDAAETCPAVAFRQRFTSTPVHTKK